MITADKARQNSNNASYKRIPRAIAQLNNAIKEASNNGSRILYIWLQVNYSEAKYIKYFLKNNGFEVAATETTDGSHNFTIQW